MRFLTSEPAVLLPGRTLVIADLHIGAEHEFRQAGIRVPSQTGKLLGKVKSLVRQTKAKKLIMLGDIKHKVPGLSFQEEREVPHFLDMLNNNMNIEVEIIPGNHDDGLKKLVPNIKIHPSSGMLFGKEYLIHGHAWPSPDFLKAKQVLSGHRHPVIEFRDRLGYVWRERVWVRAGLERKAIEKRYGKQNASSDLPELVIMPAFNEMVGGTALNKKKRALKFKRKLQPLGPLMKAVNKSEARIYMLDGTYLGKLGRL